MKMIPMPSDQEIAALMRLPPWLPVTSPMRAKIRGLMGSRPEWLADGGRLMDFLIPSGRLTAKRDADGDDLLAYLKSLTDLSPGRMLNILGRARALLTALKRPAKQTPALKSYRSNLVKTKADSRVRTAAISHDPNATAITIPDLFPAKPTTLTDAVDYLAAVFLSSFAGRPQEGVQVPMRLIKREGQGYYVDESWSKTTARTFKLEPEVIEAINLVGRFDPDRRRHWIGVDPDHLLAECNYPIVAHLNTRGTRIIDGNYTEFWFGRMMKRRVRAYCQTNGVSPKHIDSIVERVTGKAMRRGRNAAEASSGASSDHQGRVANLKTRNLLLTYADGMLLEGSPVERFVLGFLPAAQREGN